MEGPPIVEQRTVNRRYRIDRRIGEGPQAIVYLGHDLLVDRPVTVKALRPQLVGDRAMRERFGREAAVAAGLTHGNIVAVLDFGEDAGTPFIIMDYVPSETLQDIIVNEGPFGPDDVAWLLEQLAAALDFVHQRGIVHRDMTPWNVLVEPSGVAKLINIGHTVQTMPANVQWRGAPAIPAHFISPEQASGLNPTPSSDIYSLGVIAYEMLTGTLPIHAGSIPDLVAAQIHQTPPPPSSRFSGVPGVVDIVVLRALEKDPSRRYPTAGTFARATLGWNPQATMSPPQDSRDSVDAPRADDDDRADVPAGRGFRARMSKLVGLGLSIGLVLISGIVGAV